MSLEKQKIIDLIEVVANGTVQVRERTSIIEDGKEISATYHRHVVVPGADYSQEDSRVQSVCAAIHTPQVIAAYQEAIEAAQAKIEA